MKATNWIKSGQKNKLERYVLTKISAVNGGSIGSSKWNDYVQISFYDKGEDKHMRVTMTPDEAKKFTDSLLEALTNF